MARPAKSPSLSKNSRAVREPPAASETEGTGRVRPRANAGIGDELGAAELARRVAESLRRFRAERQLSLDDLSARSGVSRAALSQIEGARTNPTLTVLWKIAVGLEVPFHDLLGSNSESEVLVMRASDTPALRSADGRTNSRLLSPGGADTTTEVYDLRFQPKTVHSSDPHARGTSETLIVLSGALRLAVGAVSYELATGDSAFFRADVQHSYENRSTRETRCLNVIHYAR